MHIAILDTDVPVPAVYTTRGLYSTQFRTLLQAAANRLNARNDSKIDIQTSAYDAVGGVLPPLNRLRASENNNNNNENKELDDQDIIDGILVTGSANASYEKDTKPWIANLEVYLREVYEQFPAVRMLGRASVTRLSHRPCFRGYCMLSIVHLGMKSVLCRLRWMRRLMNRSPISPIRYGSGISSGFDCSSCMGIGSFLSTMQMK